MIQALNLWHSVPVVLLRRSQCLLAIGIFIHEALSPNPDAMQFHISAVILHFVGNILLFSSLWFAFYDYLKPKVLFIVPLCFSLSIEAAQGFIVGRDPNLFDAATNVTGILFGWLLCSGVQRLLPSVFKKA